MPLASLFVTRKWCQLIHVDVLSLWSRISFFNISGNWGDVNTCRWGLVRSQLSKLCTCWRGVTERGLASGLWGEGEGGRRLWTRVDEVRASEGVRGVCGWDEAARTNYRCPTWLEGAIITRPGNTIGPLVGEVIHQMHTPLREPYSLLFPMCDNPAP